MVYFGDEEESGGACILLSVGTEFRVDIISIEMEGKLGI